MAARAHGTCASSAARGEHPPARRERLAAALDSDDRYHEAGRRLLEASTDAEGASLAALDLTLYEVANVAVVRWLERIDDDLAGGMVSLAAKHRLTAYDAAYVAAAQRRDWTLVSGDLTDLVGPGHAVAPDAIEG